MSDTRNLPAKVEPVAVELREQVHPLVKAAMATGNSLTPESLDKLLDVQLKWEAAEARKAYTRDLVKAKADLPRVVGHDAKHSHKNFTYATLGQMVQAVTEPLARHGFTLGGDATSTSDEVTVTVTLTHTMGHSESITLSAPVDRGPKSNRTGDSIKTHTEALAGAITSLRRYAMAQLLGLATADVKPEPEPDSIDTTETLRVFGGLVAKFQVTRERCEEILGKPMKEWTRSDLAELRRAVEEPPREPGEEG